MNIEELKRKRNALYIRALKQFANSPAQLKTRREIEQLNREIERLEKRKTAR